MSHVLIVDDEPDLSHLIADYLQAASFSTTIIGDGREALYWCKSNYTDLVILDIMLPSMDGITVCRKLHEKGNIPIIMATAKIEEIDRLLGLEIGADDYICKPYSPRELVARVKAVLRRSQNSTVESQSVITLDKQRRCVSSHDQEVQLTNIELQLFELLYNDPGKIFSRQFIMENIYNDYRVVSDRTVDSHIKKLRKKLGGIAPHLDLIHSIYGVGYKYEFSEN